MHTTALTSPTTDDLYAASAVADTTKVWAAGDNGTLIYTTNGTTWNSVATSGTANALYGIAAANSTNVWAVGAAGTIVATVNGDSAGGTFTPQASGTANTLRAVATFDGTHVVAVGDSGTVRVTSDGGSTWNAPSVPPSGAGSFTGIAVMPDGSSWFAVANSLGSLQLYKSTDNGSTWTQLPGFTISGTYGATGISVALPNTVAISAQGGSFLSYDGGATWPSVDGWDLNTMMGIAAVDTDTAWITGTNSTLEVVAQDNDVADYGAGHTWGDLGSGLFGVCIQAASGVTLQGSFASDSSPPCDHANNPAWSAVPTADTPVAETNSGDVGKLDFVWGLRPALTQPPGEYVAPVTFELISPAV